MDNSLLAVRDINHKYIVVGGSFMNFYIGNSIDEINEWDINIEFSDELINFIYKLSKQVSFDMSKLYEVDPYDDVEIPENEVSQIIEICNYIMDTSLLQSYREAEEGKQMLHSLVEIAQKAMERGMGLISIGD